MRVALYDDPSFRGHDSGPGHPERAARLDAIRKGLRDAGLEPRLELRAPRPVSELELLRVHTPAHVQRIASSAGRTLRFDADTQAGPSSYEASRMAAGAAVDAVERVLAGELERAFCLCRPPGHHAEADQAMGFCLFNNVAVAAAAALERGLERVLIVDFDVHHGNGTQHVFASEPRVLYLSSHAHPFYPGTGSLDEQGEGAGRGFTVNLPLPQGAGDLEYAHVYREIVEPIGRAYAPELVLVSAGFDAWGGDPLAAMRLTEHGYAEIADVCVGLAEASARGRLVALLEGGYSLDGLAHASAAFVERLLGFPHQPLSLGDGGLVQALLGAYRHAHAPHWKVLGG